MIGRAVAVSAVLVATASAAAVPAPTLVVGGPGSNEGPVVADGWVAWMHSATPNPMPPASHTVVLVRQGDGAPWQANPPGTYAETGGITSHTLVIQLISQGRSRLATVDLTTRRLRILPIQAGPRAWLWRPSASGPWLLYGRIDYVTGTYDIVLRNQVTGVTRTLDSVGGHAAYGAPGQVNGRYAVWIGCPGYACRAYRYDLKTGARERMPVLGGVAYGHFGPSVSSSGTVYYGSAIGCADVRLVRWRNGNVRTILRFPPDTAFQYSYTSEGGVYYDKVGCDRDDLSSIYRVAG